MIMWFYKQDAAIDDISVLRLKENTTPKSIPFISPLQTQSQNTLHASSQAPKSSPITQKALQHDHVMQNATYCDTLHIPEKSTPK